MKARKFNIRVTNHSKTEGHVSYYLKIESDDGISFSIPKRYSELKILNDLLRKETNSNAFPKFPPKKFFGFNSEEFIRKRQVELDTYFQAICNSPDFSKLNSFVKFVEDCLKSQNDDKLSEKPIATPGNQMNVPKSTKPKIDPYKQRFKPNKNDFNRISPNEIKKEEEEFKKIVNESKEKFIEIDYEMKQSISEKNEKKYNDIIINDKIMENDKEININILPGNDDNFNLITEKSDALDSVENNAKQKIEEIINKGNEIMKLYDINEILKTL